MSKVVNVCLECGVETISYPSQRRKFCSLSCRSIYQARNQMPCKPRRGIELPCESCGKPVYRSKSQSNKRFCSVECQVEGQRKTVEKVCPHCAITFQTVPSTDLVHCSNDCYQKARLVTSSAGRMHNGRHVIIDHGGYYRLWEPNHPSANQGRVLEHRWVVEQVLGAYLTTDQHVHHLNGIKTDNRLENLQVMDAQDHRLLTAAEMKERRASNAAELAAYRERFGPLT